MTGIVSSLQPITLVGGGAVLDGDLGTCLQLAPGLVAADGGANYCVANQLLPDVVIGDMDSCSGLALRGIPSDRLHPINEQDSTDFDKALRNIDAPLVLGVGFMGGRIDHELACYNALVRHPDRACVLLGAEDIVFLAPASLDLPLQPGTRVSLFPMCSVEGRSRGLRWPIDGLAMSPGAKIGTSNEAIGNVHLEFTTPGMLVILPRACLREVVRALLARLGGS